MTPSNLPPGVTESMIPGNRPEDIECEQAIDEAEDNPGRVLLALKLLGALEECLKEVGLIIVDEIGYEADLAALKELTDNTP